MQHAFKNVGTGRGQSATKRAANELKPVPTPAQFKAMVESRLARLRQRTTQQADEEVTEYIAALKGQEEEVLSAIEQENELKETFRQGTVDRTDADRRIAEYTALKNEIQGQLRQYAGDPEYAQAYQDASQLMNTRRQAQAAADQIAEDHRRAYEGTEDRPQPYGKGTADVINADVESAVASNFVVKTEKGETATFTWKGVGYRSVRPADSIVSAPALELANFIGESQKFRNERNDEVENRVRCDGFLISFKSEPDGKGGKLPSELDLIQEEVGVFVKTLTALCAGKGEKTLVRLPDRQGEVLLERVAPGSSDAFLTRATNARVADQLFYWDDRNNPGARAKRKMYAINLNDLTFENVRPGWFGDAMAEQIRREAQSQENWKRADGLRDVSQVKYLIPANGLAYLREVGTCVVDARPTLMIGGREHQHELTLHIIGLDNDEFQVTEFVPGTVERLDPAKTWLVPAIEKPQPRRLLREVAEWKEVVKANSWSDRDWQVNREAAQRGAVAITRENQNDFWGINEGEGKDGFYTVRGNARGRFLENDSVGRPQFEQHAAGFIVQRTSSETDQPMLEIVWHVPYGKSAEIAKGNRGKLPLANIPNQIRGVLGNVYYLVNRTKGGPRVATPAHLIPVKQVKE